MNIRLNGKDSFIVEGKRVSFTISEFINGNIQIHNHITNDFQYLLPKPDTSKQVSLKDVPDNKTDKRIKVLSVDNEPYIINSIKFSLDKEKYDIRGAYSARECLRLVYNGNFVPDIITTGIMMPGVNGYELCQALRENVWTRNIPIIILSAKCQMNDKLHAIDVGADDYMTKPFDSKELERRIRLNLRI